MFSWRMMTIKPTRFTKTALRASLSLTLSVTMSLSAQALDGITTVEENGRKIFVNAETPQEIAVNRAAQHVSSSKYMYWSASEKRWKMVPMPSAADLSAARSAAAEVASYVSAQPKRTGTAPPQLRIPSHCRRDRQGHRRSRLQAQRRS
jgi:hypothetical protein